jgi:hypothetical protein
MTQLNQSSNGSTGTIVPVGKLRSFRYSKAFVELFKLSPIEEEILNSKVSTVSKVQKKPHDAINCAEGVSP